jgi:hypothetical protein
MTPAQRRRDEAARQDPGGDLVQQRLEKVMVGPVHDRDIDIRAGQGARDVHPAEATADDEHLVPSAGHG